MNSLTKYFSSAFDDAKHRLMTVFGMGGALTADMVAPFGDDSCPPQGADVIYMETSNDEQPVIVGVLNVGLLAQDGEKRLFSLKKNPDGSYSPGFYAWMKNDGSYELGGSDYHLLRYEQLNAALQLQVNKLQTQLTQIAAGIATAGGSYTPGDITLDISAAKIDEIKTL